MNIRLIYYFGSICEDGNYCNVFFCDLDVNECNDTIAELHDSKESGCVSRNDACVNTNGNYHCLTLTASFGDLYNEPTAQGYVDNGGSGKGSVSEELGAVESSVGTVQVALVVMVVWVIIVTIALVGVGTVSFRRWRKEKFIEDGTASSIASNEDSESAMRSIEDDIPVGKQNGGYDTDDSLSVSLEMPTPTSTEHSERELPTVHKEPTEGTKL